MADFWKAMYYVFDNEGGFSNDPMDHGGATNYGITQATLTRYIQTHRFAKVPDRVEKMSIKDAEEIYRSDYWFYDNVESQSVATKVFDMGVNMGPATAIKILQDIIGASRDGKWGPQTLALTNVMDPKEVMTGLIDGGTRHYLDILKNDPTQEKFRKGWLKRAKSTPPD